MELSCHDSVVAGGSAVILSKQPAKIAYIIESTLLTDGGKSFRSTGQKICSHRKAVPVKVFHRRLGNGGSKAAETFPFTRMGGLGDSLYCKRFRIMLMDKIKHLVHTAFPDWGERIER